VTALPDAPPVSPLPTPTTTRWRPLRAGLQNVWQYDHTTRFVFHQGRLLLRGRNGSGKTKAVEVLLPFLLEGRLDPSRLDPFRTRSRKMHYNLLHEANRDATMAVGYVWLEFGRVDADGQPRYATVGAGLKARRSDDKVDSWFFVVDDRRVDVDLDLLDVDRRPLGRPALAEELGDDGRLYDSGRDYAAAVNRTLFGLTATQYDALVEAVLRLRQPHLSERLDPVEVGVVLSDSLPPLDAGKVHEVAEGFERLEAHRRDLLDRRRSLEAVEGFLAGYRDYAAVVAAVRARELTRADAAVRDAAGRIAAAESAAQERTQRAQDLATEKAEAERGLAAADTRIETLRDSDEYRAVQDLEQARAVLRREAERVASAVARRDAEAAEAAAAGQRRDRAADAVAAKRTEVTSTARTARVRATGADLEAAQSQLADLAEAAVTDSGDVAAVRGAAESVRRARDEGIGVVRAANRAVTTAEGAQRRAAERAADAIERTTVAEIAVADAETAATDAADAFTAAVLAWRDEATELALDDAALDALLDVDPAEAAEEARRLAEPARTLLEDALADRRGARTEAAGRRAEVADERSALVAATHRPPDAPAWRTADRTQRPGAPLYLLAELTDALDADAQGGVEAALEAAGVLDAWVTPEGRVLDGGGGDVALPGGPLAPGRTLADVARPTPHGGVDAEVVRGVLARVGLGAPRSDGGSADGPHAEDPRAAWVAPDGRFGIGPLRGRAQGTALRYLGETAREAARQRRLAELDAALADLDATIARLTGEVEELVTRRRLLDADLAALPPATGVLTARAAVTASVGALEAAREEAARLRDALDAAQAATEAARAQRDVAAAEVGLAAHVDTLDELAAALGEWRAAVAEWLTAADALRERSARLRDLEAALAAATERHADAADAAEAAQTEHDAAAERVDTLRGMVGAAHEQVLADLDATRRRREELTGRTAQLGEGHLAAREAAAVAGKELEVATAEHGRLDGERATAAEQLRGLAVLGVLQVVLDRPLPDAEGWAVRTTLEHAREAAKVGPSLPGEPDEIRALLESAQNALARRQQELLRDLVAGIRLFGRTDHGVVVHDVQYQGRTFRLPELVAELAEDVAEREARLAGDEQGLLETFLAGELHEHLRSRIRDADELVTVMNERLASCPTAAGQRVRLDWAVAEDAPAGTREALDLLLRGAGLLDDEQRAELRAFLHQRLREARDGDAAASLHERLAEAFDYRAWHAFTIQVRDRNASSWRRLTRQSHATGSGGEKAVMLHLPLFAAMAAHYQASPTAPRLIVLDEVFAGIDRGTRGQLMGLLVSLDLDALLTSHEEWGFYAELDGISTYHLIRDPDIAGVFPEWFVWDGATRWELG
jgi:uncharacterized protein (TIGR02680 family)